MHERFVLRDVVGAAEVYLEHVVETVALGGGDDDPGSRAVAHLRAVEVKVPVGGVGTGGRYWVSAQSTRKSARACDLIAVLGSY